MVNPTRASAGDTASTAPNPPRQRASFQHPCGHSVIRTEVQRRQVHHDRLGLQRLRCQRQVGQQGMQLRLERRVAVELHRQADGARHRLPGHRRHLGELVGGEVVGEVEKKHAIFSLLSQPLAQPGQAVTRCSDLAGQIPKPEIVQ